MPVSPVRFATSVETLRPAFDEIRAELEIEVGFPADVMAEAEQAARRGPSIPAATDRRDIALVSIDPEGSRDLDQAVAIERASSNSNRGYVVWYAIADVAAFVKPGGAIDRIARERGVTVYLPDARAPLHPPVLSEGAMSLSPGEDRQALLWRFELDSDAAVRAATLERATVRNRHAVSYDEVQRQLDDGSVADDGTFALLGEVGRRREEAERARGGVALEAPEQIVTAIDGAYALAFRSPLPVEGWNAQISLMTGIVAADVMLGAGVGILRTLPKATLSDVDVLRRHAKGLDIEWPTSMGYAELIRSLDLNIAEHAALLAQAARLFRGAGYSPFDVERGIAVPPEPEHAAVAAPYAHVTAPLRRLVDRFGNEIALAAVRGAAVPEWARVALPELAEAMSDARRREGAADGRAADLVEAAVLAGCVGAELDGVVVRLHRKGVQVQIRTPAVVANVDGNGQIQLGDTVRVRVDAADPIERRVRLSLVS